MQSILWLLTILSMASSVSSRFNLKPGQIGGYPLNLIGNPKIIKPPGKKPQAFPLYEIPKMRDLGLSFLKPKAGTKEKREDAHDIAGKYDEELSFLQPPSHIAKHAVTEFLQNPIYRLPFADDVCKGGLKCYESKWSLRTSDLESHYNQLFHQASVLENVHNQALDDIFITEQKYKDKVKWLWEMAQSYDYISCEAKMRYSRAVQKCDGQMFPEKSSPRQKKENYRRMTEDHPEDDHGLESQDPLRKGEYVYPQIPDYPGKEDDHGLERQDPKHEGEYNHPQVSDHPGKEVDHGLERQDPKHENEYKHPEISDQPGKEVDHGLERQDPKRKGQYNHPKISDHPGKEVDHGLARQDPKRKGEYNHPRIHDHPGKEVDHGLARQDPKRKGEYNHPQVPDHPKKFVDHGLAGQDPKSQRSKKKAQEHQ